VLAGGVFTDSMGRHSKRLQLQGGKQVVVRKMACHSGFAYGASPVLCVHCDCRSVSQHFCAAL
jgi:hypothetical protein